jgi:hypothetical protein
MKSNVAKQEQVVETARIEREDGEEKIKALREQNKGQREKKTSLTQTKETLRQAWVDLRANDGSESQPAYSVETGRQ